MIEARSKQLRLLIRAIALKIVFREDAGIAALRLGRTISFLGQRLIFRASEMRGNALL